MDTMAWRMGFHLMPPTGWLNDPNGLCQFRGVYHVFHQYSPNWPAAVAPRGWGHFYSEDLVHWRHQGLVIAPDTPDDASGAYSGSALVVPGAARDGGPALRLYYTGNVKEPGDFDYIHAGRQANELVVTSDDGFAFSPKRVLMRNADYPAWCTRHVRDPKVWRQDGTLWMVLGARTVADEGVVLLYRSSDGISWQYAGVVRSRAPFGYMWECPDRIALNGAEYLAVCPQGMEEHPWAHGLRDQAGYFELDGARLIDAAAGEDADASRLESRLTVAEGRFHLWDEGFDFYAPQTFVDDAGRTLLIAWMGMPAAPYTSRPAWLAWEHCLTVPRVLARCEDGRIAQMPVPELDELHGERFELEMPGSLRLPAHRADVRFEGIDGRLTLAFDNALQLSYHGGELTLSFVGAAALAEGVGAGRGSRTMAVGALRDLRVLVDDSAIEVFANGGRHAFATRWFPVDDALTISASGCCAQATAWTMGDGMGATYDAS